MSQKGLKVNAKKSFFDRNEIECLEFRITKQGIMTLPDKVEVVKNIVVPTSKKQLRSFIGLINYYRDIWQHRSKILNPSSSMSSKQAKWNYRKEYHKVFDKIKMIVPRETLLSYPNFNKPFEIHMDASKLQLGSVISQKGKLIAFSQSYTGQLYYYRI